MDNVLTKSFLFITRAFVKSLFIVIYVSIKFVGTILLLIAHVLACDITACKSVFKNSKKQFVLGLERMFDDIELLTWATTGFAGNFLTKENADRFASLGLFALLIACIKALLKSLLVSLR